MNVDYYQAVHAITTALATYTWLHYTTTPAPTVYEGSRSQVDVDGPVILLNHGTQGAETALVPSQRGFHTKVVVITGAIPWDDSQQNFKDISDIASDLDQFIADHRHLSGSIRTSVKGVVWNQSPEMLSSVSQNSRWRSVSFMVGLEDARFPV